MCKVLFVYSRVEPKIEASGEANKMKMQMSALETYNIKTDIFYHNRNIKNNKILIRLPFYNIYGRDFVDQISSIISEYDALYIRKYIFDNSFFELLKRVRKGNPHIKIILEIPTYPYDQEWSSFIDRPMLIKDQVYRKKLYRYIDRIVTFSDDKYIFKVKCLNTSNGINPSIYKCRNYIVKKDTQRIDIMGVAALEKWHGYDRIIKGLYSYYKDKYEYKVVFHIVGDGAEKANLERLVHSLQLEDYVIFHGSMYGDQLNSMFDRCDIGIGSLGMHRIGLIDGYTLKLREYMSRGIPFIYGYNDRLIEKHPVSYMIKVSADETEIDINSVVHFYEELELCKNHVDIGQLMHENAVQYLSWESQMKPIANYIIRSRDAGKTK